jgi:hypothetical protein
VAPDGPERGPHPPRERRPRHRPRPPHLGLRPGPTPAPTTRPFHVTTGSAPDLAGAIRSAPRAIVFVDEPTSTYSAAGHKKFLDDARSLARDHAALGVRFFVVERQYAPETVAWLDGLRDERLEPLGRRMKGYGGLVWLEYGRVVDADVLVGAPDTDPNLAERTRALWGGGR